MAQDQFKRKLTTILIADVAGYSRLMGDDEAATVKTLGNYKQIMAELIRRHRGRVVDSPGDNLLAGCSKSSLTFGPLSPGPLPCDARGFAPLAKTGILARPFPRGDPARWPAPPCS